MKNKIDLINDCFSMLLRTGVTVNASPSDNVLALNRLEDMMAELESRNLATGYNFEDSPEPDSPSGLENWMNLAISQMLAMRVWPDFSPDEVNPMLARNSAQSSANLSARLAQQNALKYARRTPLGSGNQPYQQYNKFFGDYGSTCGPSDSGSGGCAPVPTPPPLQCSCDVIPLSHLKLLGDEALFGASEKQYSITGFYSGSTVGGGLFVFNPDGNKSTHNGVTVYAPEALQAWSGTQADIATLLNWTGVGSGVWVRILNGFVTPEMAGAVGDGSNENDSLQKALNISQNSLFILAGGKNYGFTQLEIKSGTTIVSNSSTFTRMSPSTAHGMIINGNVSVDMLSIFSQGGPTGDRAILLKGGNFKAGCVSVYAASEGSFTSVNWAMEIDSGSAEVLSNIAIDCFKVINYRCAMFAKRVNSMIVNDITVQFYQLAFYLQDCQDISMDVASISGLSTTLTGNPGENGILMESTYSNASNNIRISNWHVKDSGEHGYRMGGQFTISDVYFENCISTRPGRAGYVAWPLASEWHGGCGFKVIGGTSTTGQRHKNIHLNNCTVIDCDINPTFGIGHGVNNFTAYQVFVCEDVFITDCKVKNSGSQAYSALQGLIIGATNNIHISNFDCDATERPALKLHDEPPTSAGWSFGINGLYINGAVLRVRVANVAVIYAESVRYSHSDWKLKDINCYGGRSAIRLETPSTGSHPTDALVDLSYQGSDSDEATVTTAIVTGSRVFRAAVTAPWRVMATDPSFKDGTFYTDTITGNIRIRKSGSWNVL